MGSEGKETGSRKKKPGSRVEWECDKGRKGCLLVGSGSPMSGLDPPSWNGSTWSGDPHRSTEKVEAYPDVREQTFP